MNVILYLVVSFVVVHGEYCNRFLNCLPPDCRCFAENEIPGGLSPKDVPQMIVVTMDYALNSEYSELYDQLFENTNPNDCPSVGTFFLQDRYTNYDIVKSYYDRGFEIGISSTNGILPTDTKGWIKMIKYVKNKISRAGIKCTDVRGYRAPQLAFGGNAEFTGKWQILIPDTKVNNTKCAVPQGCDNIRTKKDAFDILYDNFVLHYEGDRIPYYMLIDAAWMKTDFKKEGTIDFIQYLRSAFPDTYLVTAWQALQWVQNPTPLANITSFKPWSCRKHPDVASATILRYPGQRIFRSNTRNEFYFP